MLNRVLYLTFYQNVRGRSLAHSAKNWIWVVIFVVWGNSYSDLLIGNYHLWWMGVMVVRSNIVTVIVVMVTFDDVLVLIMMMAMIY